MAAYQRALDADEHCIDAINALERLYRRTQAWDRLVDVLSKKSQVVNDTDQAIRLKLQVGELWEDRLGDNDRAVDAYKEVLSVDPRNLPALTAPRRALREDRAHGGVPREPRAPARGVAARGGSRRDVPEDGDDLGRELLQARSRDRGAGEDPPHRRAQREGVPRSGAPVPPGAQVGVAGRDLPQAPRGHDRHDRADRPVHQDRPGLRAGAARPRSRHRFVQRRALRRGRSPRRAGRPGAPLRGDGAVGARRRDDAEVDPRQHAIRARRSTSTTGWARSSTSR